MNKTDGNIKRRVITYGLPCTVTGRHWFNTAIERAKLATELQWLEILKESDDIYLEGELEMRIDAVSKRVNRLAEILATRQGTCLTDCEEVSDYSKKRVRISQLGTGEVVEDRAMTAEEWRGRPRAVRVSKPRTRKKVLLQGKAPAAAHQLAASAS